MGGLFSRENPYVRKALLSNYVLLSDFKLYKDYAGNNFLSQAAFDAYKKQVGDEFTAYKDYSGGSFTSQAAFNQYKKEVEEAQKKYAEYVNNTYQTQANFNQYKTDYDQQIISNYLNKKDFGDFKNVYLPATYQPKGEYVNSQSYNRELEGVLSRFDNYQPKGDYVKQSEFNSYRTDNRNAIEENLIKQYLPATYQPKGEYVRANDYNTDMKVIKTNLDQFNIPNWNLYGDDNQICFSNTKVNKRICVDFDSIKSISKLIPTKREMEGVILTRLDKNIIYIIKDGKGTCLVNKNDVIQELWRDFAVPIVYSDDGNILDTIMVSDNIEQTARQLEGKFKVIIMFNDSAMEEKTGQPVDSPTFAKIKNILLQNGVKNCDSNMVNQTVITYKRQNYPTNKIIYSYGEPEMAFYRDSNNKVILMIPKQYLGSGGKVSPCIPTQTQGTIMFMYSDDPNIIVDFFNPEIPSDVISYKNYFSNVSSAIKYGKVQYVSIKTYDISTQNPITEQERTTLLNAIGRTGVYACPS